MFKLESALQSIEPNPGLLLSLCLHFAVTNISHGLNTASVGKDMQFKLNNRFLHYVNINMSSQTER